MALLRWVLPIFALLTANAGEPLVYPAPRHMEVRAGALRLERSVPVLLPEHPTSDDLFLARFLIAELTDRFGATLETKTVRGLPKQGPFIVLGALTNPLVAEYCRENARPPAEREGYVLHVDRDRAVVAGTDEAGAFYGLQSLRQLLGRDADGVRAGAVDIQDWPFKPFRGIKLYLPGPENIAYFKRFVRNVMSLYKYNTLIMEMNAGMRLYRHPELNAGAMELASNMLYTRRERSWGPGRQFQDSANADTADGGVLEQEDVADLVHFARQHHIDVIPEIPSLTHSYYLLARHRELAEIQAAEWPDTYCPSEPRVYDLLFDVLDEYIDVMHPAMVHAGHDEWRMPVGVCARCKGKDPRELFAADLNRIYEHLRAKGVRTAIWGDHLMETLRGEKVRHVDNPDGTPYDAPGGLTPEQVRKLIPKDILIFNWFWDTSQDEDLKRGLGEASEKKLADWGFRQVFGNFEPHFQDFNRRTSIGSMLGAAPSSWAATNELNFGKDLMLDFVGSANLLWSTERPNMNQLAVMVQRQLPAVRRGVAAAPLPSWSDAARPLALPVQTAEPVRIGEDVSSLIFLHACRKPGRNEPAYTGTWNYADTAELLGWYEAVYEDGFVASIPVRYGVNILEESWLQGAAPKNLAYEAELRPKGGKAYFAYEWANPRFGKAIREVRLHSLTPSNPVVLAGLSVVEKRPVR
ncbi:MAG TPA: beta-N-acetylhexosaminidase [Bryobacteraceae bacterium]